MRFQCIFLLCALCLVERAHSQNAQTNSSSSKDAFVNAIIGGFHKVGTSGVILGYKPLTSLETIVLYQEGETNIKNSLEYDKLYVGLSKHHMYARRFELAGRYFWGDTFFVKGGASHGDLGIKLHITDNRFSNWSKAKAEIQRVGASIGIGNRWLLAHNLRLEGEWIGFDMPLTYNESSAVVPDASGSDRATTTVKNNLSRLVNDTKSTLVTLVQLGIGVEF